MTTGRLTKANTVISEIHKRLGTSLTTSSPTSAAEEPTEDNNPWIPVYKAQEAQNRFLPRNWTEKHFDFMKVDAGSQLEKIVSVLKARTLDDKVGLWLSGQAGHGKTHLLLSLFNSLSYQFYYTHQGLHNQVKFYNYADLCGILRQDPNNYDLFCKQREAELLFIDDIGVSKSTDFIQEKIYSIFNYRCENELPTFVTTNLQPQQVSAEFTERMASRIRESAAWIELKAGKDFRSNKFIKNMEKYQFITKG